MSTSNLIRPGGGSRPGRLLALLTATAVAASLLSVPLAPTPAAASVPAATDARAAPGLLPSEAEPVEVTLITGDTVHWLDSGDGNARVVEIEEARRDHPVTFDQSGTQEDFYVIPTDVMEHVAAGTVDEELFNIPGLIRNGLDDASTGELPVIVTFDQERSAQQLTRDADALPAASNPTVLGSMNGAGIRVDRKQAGTFREAVLGKPGRDRSARTTSARGLDGAVEQVRLDRMLTIDLADSVPQIGAPQAWDAGYTGEGVTVAVLDTGIDTSHPDLTGQVVASANFTNEPDATDTHGHGTHVAATIAGTGAASDGARMGVASGAELLSGKVCTTDGQCSTSAIMAGMEWATAQGADIVNMSLGSDATDGTDPLSQLVNQLSAETGALFVTSAGNTSRPIRVVGAPAAADAALAVGAVDKSDQRASFSSQGPRVGDHAVKPEITAPGVGIVAARAEGTTAGEPVDDLYTSLNGTSMASPHVAGAAALLAQASGLAGGDLKDALVSTAVDGGYSWYQQGTGRVDVPAALESPVYAAGTLNFGGVEGRAEKELVYTNRSDDDITLTLQSAVTDLDGQPYDGVTLSADAITVPANGNASVIVTVMLDASNLTGQESFGGAVIATGPDDLTLRTGIGFGPPLRRITIEVLDSNGKRVGSDTSPDWRVSLTHDTLDRDSGGTEVYRLFTNEGIAVGHVPTGTYTVISDLLETEPGAPLEVNRISMLVEAEIAITADVTVTLDARDAVPIKVSVPRKTDQRNHAMEVIRELPGSNGKTFKVAAFGGNWPLFATPAPPGELASIGLFVSWTLAEPQPVQPVFGEPLCSQLPFWCFSETPAYIYNLPILYENGIPANLHERITRRELVEVPTRFHSDHPGALVLQQFNSLLEFPTVAGVGDAVRIWFRPGTVTEYFLAADRFTWNRVASRQYREANVPPTFLFTQWSSDQFPAAEAGARRDEERWFAGPARVGIPDIREEYLDNPREVERTARGIRGGADGDLFIPAQDAIDNSRGHLMFDWGSGDWASWRMWNLDTGTELEDAGRAFRLASEEAIYRLEQTDQYPEQMVGQLFRTGPASTTWTFTSRPSDARVPHGYRCAVRLSPRENICQIQPLIQLEYDLGLDIHNQAPARRAHVFTILAGHHSKAVDRAPITSLRVQASYDDGQTWHEVRFVGRPRDSFDTGGFLPSSAPYQEFLVILRHPELAETNGFVTLRTRAEDANGGTVEQTIHRAYGLK